MRRLRCLCLGLGLSAGICTTAMPAVPLPEGTEVPAAYIADVDGRVVASHAARAHRQPASLAKLAGALAVMEQASRQVDLLDSTARISANAARARGTRIGLRAGDLVPARDLLAAMLIGSANDACLAIAEHVSGGATAFVSRMNAIAARLGMVDTRFVDPCGFDYPGQRTTAADLLLLARTAMADSVILDLAQRRVVWVTPLRQQRVLYLLTTNALLDRYDGAFGLKTGYTGRAGPCVIAAARRGATVATVVILGGRDRWPVSVALLDYAFSNAPDTPRAHYPAVIGEPNR